MLSDEKKHPSDYAHSEKHTLEVDREKLDYQSRIHKIESPTAENAKGPINSGAKKLSGEDGEKYFADFTDQESLMRYLKNRELPSGILDSKNRRFYSNWIAFILFSLLITVVCCTQTVGRLLNAKMVLIEPSPSSSQFFSLIKKSLVGLSLILSALICSYIVIYLINPDDKAKQKTLEGLK